MLWRAGRGFVVRDLPWSEEKLRAIPPFEFENWAVIGLGGIPNKVQVGDMVVLTIAQPFMAGFTVRKRHQSRQGRKNWSAVPGGTRKIGLRYSQP
jgi:hypothetical protein